MYLSVSVIGGKVCSWVVSVHHVCGGDPMYVVHLALSILLMTTTSAKADEDTILMGGRIAEITDDGMKFYRDTTKRIYEIKFDKSTKIFERREVDGNVSLTQITRKELKM